MGGNGAKNRGTPVSKTTTATRSQGTLDTSDPEYRVSHFIGGINPGSELQRRMAALDFSGLSSLSHQLMREARSAMEMVLQGESRARANPTGYHHERAIAYRDTGQKRLDAVMVKVANTRAMLKAAEMRRRK